MSNKLTDARAELAELLAAEGLRVYLTPPEDPDGGDDPDVPLEDAEDLDDETNPDPAASPFPLLFVVPADPYVTYEQLNATGEVTIHLNVSAVSSNGATDDEAEEVDGLVVQTLDALAKIADGSAWRVEQVNQPGRVVVNGQVHLACPIECLREIQLHD